MDEQTRTEIAKSVALAGDLLAKLDTETEELLNWFLQIIANQKWQDVKYANSWDEVLQHRALAEWLDNVDLRAILERFRDDAEEALK